MNDRRAPYPLLMLLWVCYGLLAILIRLRPLSRTDVVVTRAIQSRDHRALERVMTFVSWFGFRPQSLILPLGTIFAFWFRGMRLEAVLLVVAWASSMCSFLTKLVIRRPRPDNSLVRVVIAKTRDTSFPSGHVVHYTTFWGFAFYLLTVRGMFQSVGRLFGVAMIPIIALVGPSRVYLGHHWFTDVAGSYLLGSAYLAGLIEVHGMIRHEFGQLPESSASGWTAGASQWLR